jgi:formyl-CoA transferase
MEKWGLGYDELSKINPRLIMIRVSGYGQSGPYAAKAGYGSIGEAMGGLRYVVGDPAAPPSRMGISIGDTLAATFACIGGLMALHNRERTGRGQIVDSAIYEAVLAVMESLITEYDKTGYVRERTGAILPNVAPSNVYPTRDGIFVLIAANQDSVFARLAQAMGRPELATDPRYSSHTARGERQVELDALIAEWTRTMDAAVLGPLLDDHGVPRGDIYRAPEMLQDAHFKARQAIVEVMHPAIGRLKMQNVAPRLSETPGRIASTGPELGEHNDDVFGKLLGLGEAERNRLAEQGVIGKPRAKVA